MPELADDPDFADNATRVRNTERLTRVLSDAFRKRTRAAWMERLNAVGVPCAPVLTVSEVYASDDVRRRRIATSIPHPTAGTVPNVRSPILMSATPTADPVAPPLLGQHTRSVLHEALGLDDAAFDALAGLGAFGPPA